MHRLRRQSKRISLIALFAYALGLVLPLHTSAHHHGSGSIETTASQTSDHSHGDHHSNQHNRDAPVDHVDDNDSRPDCCHVAMCPGGVGAPIDALTVPLEPCPAVVPEYRQAMFNREPPPLFRPPITPS